MDVGLVAISGVDERRRSGEIADDGMGSALADAVGFLPVAHQRSDLVSRADEGLEHCRPDVACGASQEDPHTPTFPVACRDWQ